LEAPGVFFSFQFTSLYLQGKVLRNAMTKRLETEKCQTYS